MTSPGTTPPPAAHEVAERSVERERVVHAVGTVGALDEIGELLRPPEHAVGEGADAVAGATPVTGRREDARRDRDRVQVGEQRPDRVVDRERMTGRATCGADEHRQVGERLRVDHVDERLEKARVARREDRRDRDEPVGRGHGIERLLQLGRGEAHEEVVGDVVREVAQLERLHLDLDATLAQEVHGVGRQPVCELAGGARRAETGRHDDDALGGHRTTAFRVAAGPKAAPDCGLESAAAGPAVAASWYGEPTVRLSPRFAFGVAWRGAWSPYFACTSDAWVVHPHVRRTVLRRIPCGVPARLLRRTGRAVRARSSAAVRRGR